jgi:hypothetical protein
MDPGPVSSRPASPRAGVADGVLFPVAQVLCCLHSLAPHARWRAAVVAYRRADTSSAPDPSAAAAKAGHGRAGSPRYRPWAALMRRAFDPGLTIGGYVI